MASQSKESILLQSLSSTSTITLAASSPPEEVEHVLTSSHIYLFTGFSLISFRAVINYFKLRISLDGYHFLKICLFHEILIHGSISVCKR